MMHKHGFAATFTLLLSLLLTGCFGGNGSSEAGDYASDRSADSSDASENLSITDDFSVQAGVPHRLVDAGTELTLEGRVSASDGIVIEETYWRIFDQENGFQRLSDTVQTSDAPNTYPLTAPRRVTESLAVYQFVAVDSEGYAAVDTVYVRVNAFQPSFTTRLLSEVVIEGEPVEIAVQIDEPLDEDLSLSYRLKDGTALVGEDIADCGPCSLTLPAGETQVTLSLLALQDQVEEGQESFQLIIESLPESSAEPISIELVINDAIINLRMRVNFVDSSTRVLENAGWVNIPLNIDTPLGDGIDILPPDLLVPSAEVGQSVSNEVGTIAPRDGYLAPLQLIYDGTAINPQDYAADYEPYIAFDADNNPYISLYIEDDTASEPIETIVMRLQQSEAYEVGESNEFVIEIQSDDIRHLAAARDSYCAVSDHSDIRCWGDFVDGKTATPPMGDIVKLVGADDYFCAIHRDDGNRSLDCWGDVPGAGLRGW